jgi:hypothetical protein
MLDKRTQQLLMLCFFLLHAINKATQFACTLILPLKSLEEGMENLKESFDEEM